MIIKATEAMVAMFTVIKDSVTNINDNHIFL